MRLHYFATGKIPPSARTNEQEMELISKGPLPLVVPRDTWRTVVHKRSG